MEAENSYLNITQRHIHVIFMQNNYIIYAVIILHVC